ncbi:hypothetical protein [Xenorhabdus bovienii]|uniref:Uncharacterized protein n=1 Tax=Xenorhabdus bovienii str. kraussei Quebec TaxID=1398203 RepID=A0A077PCI1_XENBV|nr:hypothetical protein [Xenorhabdus bovienii]CDH18753.1 hypothetical protein XBKQ1_1500003 [Xenorhabdus bovienii str. kraussei Quebec]
MIEAVARTDGLARQYMFEASLSPQATDQKLLAETSEVPLAIVNGAGDPFINHDYLVMTPKGCNDVFQYMRQ